MRAILIGTMFVCSTALGVEEAPRRGTAVVMAPDGDGRSDGKRVVIRRVDGGQVNVEVRSDTGWLGVSVESVPEPLAAQLGLEAEGVLIRNVVKDSPADLAGFQPHDVVLSINGEPVGPDVEGAVTLIADRAPGETIRAEVLRGGRVVDISATLGSRADPEARAFSWKFEAGPDAVVEDEVRTRGRFMFRDPDGRWILRDLGDVEDLEMVPDEIKVMLPESGNRTVRVYVENGETRIRTRVERDGEVLEVEKTGDGEITVTRTDPDGRTTTEVYSSVEELREADPEAHDLLAGAGGGVYQLDLKALDDGAMQFNFDMDVDGEGLWHADPMGAPHWNEEIAESMREAQDAYARALEELKALQGEDFELPNVFFSTRPDIGMPPMMKFGKPRHTFEVRTDGTIEARIRKGDSELVQLYRDEQDLAARNPELAEKYRQLMDAGR